MAERTVTWKECDHLQCRNKKGVQKVDIAIITADGGDAVIDREGELCPAHVGMAKKFIEGLFNNKKSYPE